MNEKNAIIIGAGPAGLTAAYELLHKTEIKPIIYEMSNEIGGICKTVLYKGNRIDIGGHRFFSKSERVMKWWLNILPLQGAPARDDIILGREVPLSKKSDAPDPEKTDRVMLTRERLSRILFLKKFFDYPLSLGFNTLYDLGLIRVIKITLSYIKTCIFPINPEKTLEDFFINRFGKELYQTFFKDYTQKVWGVTCSQIGAEWGVQRVKGLSISRAIAHAFKNIFWRKHSVSQKRTETSLIGRFVYPKYGPGQMWQEVARIVKEKGGELHLEHKVVGLTSENCRIVEAQIKNEVTGEVKTATADYFFSTMPVADLIESFSEPVPEDVRQVAQGLSYRDFITVGLLLKKLRIKNQSQMKTLNGMIPDHWVYIQEPTVEVGRIQIFNNWSPYMVKDENTVWIGLEYFCNEGDRLWRMPDKDLTEFAVKELVKIGFIEKADVLDSTIIRMLKTYPAYFGTYDRFDVIQSFTDGFENLFLIGRNGMHKYNNTDHSMLSAMVAVENIINDVNSKANLWELNTEQQYHELKLTSVENLVEAYIERTLDSNFKYNPDVYWEDAGISYPYYPTVRHRKRFIINSIRKYGFYKQNAFIFDYGCGEGNILKEIKEKFHLNYDQLGGSDISKIAIDTTKKELGITRLYNDAFPKLDRKCNVIVCSELIEHTKDYLDVLHWIKNNLTNDGLLILTTQAGKIHNSDEYTGHTQHFNISQLNFTLEKLRFNIKYSSLWGFPLFTLQKYLTDVNFERVQNSYLEGELTTRKKIIFNIAYFLYFIHDFINFGPQIFIIASNTRQDEPN